RPGGWHMLGSIGKAASILPRKDRAMPSRRRLSRRQFLGRAAAACAAPLVLSSSAVAANERIALGFIGVGKMGLYHVRRFLGHKDVQVVAVCDVVAERRDNAQKVVETHYGKDKGEYKGCKTYKDFRELLGRDDINAVVIATPDHWHTIPCIQAA